MQHTARQRAYRAYWSACGLLTAGNLSRFYELGEPSWLLLYQLLLIGTYSLMLIGLPCLLTRITQWHMPALTAILAVLLGGLVQLVLCADLGLWNQYGFHINGFVWDLITTPGGMSELGISAATERDMTVLSAGVFALHSALLMAAFFLTRFHLPLPRAAWVIPLFLVATIGERVAYSFSHFYGYTPLLESAEQTPFYQPLTMRRLLEQRFGLERPQRLAVEGTELKGQLAYPLEPLLIDKPERPLNLIWLVADSWRADTLNPTVMPSTSAFAGSSQYYNQHYAGGNGTRTGLFSQLYGLAANLMPAVLNARAASPLIDVLQQQDYQLRLFSSARFSAAQLERTAFVNITPVDMIEDVHGPAWQRDQRNVDRLLSFIDQRDPARPFMTFMFFQSTQAPYSFAPVIEPDHLPELSALRVNPQEEIDAIHKRYLNAAHQLDSQLGRIIRHLQDKRLLNNTLLVITADHGEAFMENGRWGHNSAFTEEQLRVPLLLYVPGRSPYRENLRTSHTDLLPTLLPLLGVRNPAQHYSVGTSLFSPQPGRTLLAGDWQRLAFMTTQYKLVLPFSSGDADSLHVSTADDLPVNNPDEVLKQSLPQIQEQMRTLRNFLAR